VGADPMPGGGLGPSGDPVDNLQRFIDLIVEVSKRHAHWQDVLAGVDVELDAQVSEAGAALGDIRERLDRFEDELQAAGGEAQAAVQHLAEQAEAIGAKELPAATAQLVALDAAVESQVGAAINDLQQDADALDQKGYDVLKANCDTAEGEVAGAQQSLDSGFQAVLQALEDTTRLVETTSATSVTDIDEQAREVGSDAVAFTGIAAEATRVWSEDLTGLVNAAVPERKKEVEELYQALDESEVEGHAEFEAGQDKALDAAQQALEQAEADLKRTVKRAGDELDRQEAESTATFHVANNGASALGDLGGGSFLKDLDFGLDVLGTIDDLLKAM
jgi:hypothetical protein